LLGRKDGFDLVEAALWIAAEEYRELQFEPVLGDVHRLASQGSDRAAGLDNPFARLDAVRGYLFEELRFRGNLDDYDDPGNSYLNVVMERRTGVPLTLSILFMEVARAAGFQCRGVALPGHFVTRVEWQGRRILVDPFHGGRVITEEDCRSLVGRSTGRPSLFRIDQLEGVGGRSMLGRLLLNLKHVYLSGGDYVRALAAVERLLLVWPGDSSEIRDMGFIKAHLGRPGAAIADLETYLSIAPGAPDTEAVKGRLVWLRRKLASSG
jgi:regulator of sirC expression with transglutaminase-like and TPR domain